MHNNFLNTHNLVLFPDEKAGIICNLQVQPLIILLIFNAQQLLEYIFLIFVCDGGHCLFTGVKVQTL